jgi:hypothetical protein
MSGTDLATRERYLEEEGNDVSVFAAIALLSTMGTQPFVQAWEDALPARAGITGLSFPKVDANELKPFEEPLSVRFPKVDANELKPFSEPITETFPRIDANELKPFPSELELR